MAEAVTLNNGTETIPSGLFIRKGKAMRKQREVLVVMVITAVVGASGGCGSLRFAPGEAQKQNAYLHHKTVQAAAIEARQEAVSPALRELTGTAASQSEAIMAYYGLPQEIPQAQSVEDILSDENEAVTRQARQAALQRPDPWDVADNLMEFGLALAGVVGGVYGSRVAATIRVARQKSKALREIVTGNELFKKEHPEATEFFKKAHQQQSEDTRQLVTAMK